MTDSNASSRGVFTAQDGSEYSWKCPDPPNGGICITACRPASNNLEIPETIGGFWVVEIGVGAFASLSDVESIRCPSGVVKIGARAFEKCYKLHSLYLPENLSNFDAFWIRGCESIEELQLPGMLDSIGSNLFTSNIPVKRLLVGKGTKSVSPTFLLSSELESISIHPCNPYLSSDGLAIYSADSSELVAMAVQCAYYELRPFCKRISDRAFSYDKALQQIKFSEGLEEIGSFAFAASGLKALEFPHSLKRIANRAFYQCQDLGKVQLVDGLQSIGEEAFAKTALENIFLPSSVREIGHAAFGSTPLSSRLSANPELLQIDEQNQLIAVADGALYRRKPSGQGGQSSQGGQASHSSQGGQASHSSQGGQSGQGNQGNQASQGGQDSQTCQSNQSSQANQDGQSNQSSQTETDCELELFEMVDESASNLTIQSGTVSIGKAAFLGHQSIRSVSLPEKLRSIGDEAFKSCPVLTHADFPDTLETIGDEAFADSPLSNLKIPKGFKSMGRTPFICRSINRKVRISMLTDVQVDPECPGYFLESGLLCERESARLASKSAEPDMLALGDIAMPSGASVLMYVGPDTDVTVPSEVSSIGPYAFCGARGIETLRLHSQVSYSGFRGIPVDGSVHRIIIQLAKAVDNHTRAEIVFPAETLDKTSVANSFAGGRLDAETLFHYSDAAVYYTKDLYIRSRMSISRLSDPLFLSDTAKERYLVFFDHYLTRICVAFALNDYTEGFERMMDLGILDSNNIGKAIDAVSAKGDTKMTGYLLEMKRRFFGGAVELDFSI